MNIIRRIVYVALLLTLSFTTSYSQNLVELVRSGNEAIQLENWEKAIDIMSTLLDESLSPDQKLNVLTSLGYAYWKNGNVRDGKDFTEQAIRHAQANQLTESFGYISAQQNAGGICRTIGEYDRALDHLILAKELTSDLYGSAVPILPQTARPVPHRLLSVRGLWLRPGHL